MQIFTKAKVSPPGKLNIQDLKNWSRNLLIFVGPVLIVYLLQLSGALQNGALTLKSLVPTAQTQGAIELYVVNGILDFLRKLKDGTK